MKIPITYAFGFSLLALASAARANLLVNGALESAIPPKQPDNLVYVTPSLNSTALTGWTIERGSIDIVPSSYYRSSQGNYSVDMVGTPGLGVISQSFTSIASNQYILTFDFSTDPNQGPLREKLIRKIMRIQAIGQDGVTVLASQDFSDNVRSRSRTRMQWAQKSFTFTADGTITTLRLAAIAVPLLPRHLTGDRLFTGVAIDNLDLEAGGGGSVPEPATLGVLSAAAAGLLMRRRRRA